MATREVNAIDRFPREKAWRICSAGDFLPRPVLTRVSLGSWAASSIHTVKGAASPEGELRADRDEGTGQASRGAVDPSYRQPLEVYPSTSRDITVSRRRLNA